MSNLVKNLRNPDWVKEWFDQAGFQAANRIDELEAKLEKAEGALYQIVGKKYYADDPWTIARTTLAELKGQNDE